MAAGRGVDHDQVPVAAGVELVEALGRDVVVGGHELPGDVLVERVAEDRVTGGGVRRVTPHQRVPRLLRVQHGHPQLAAGRLDRRRLDPDRHVAQRAVEPQGGGQPPGGVDGEHQHLAGRAGGHPGAERGGEGRLADAARPAHHDQAVGVEQPAERREPPAAAAAAPGPAGCSHDSSSPERSGDGPGGRQPRLAPEALGQVEHGHVGQTGPQLGQVGGALAAQVDGEAGRVEHGVDRRPQLLVEQSPARPGRHPFEERLLPVAEELRQHPVGDDGGHVHHRLRPQPAHQLLGLGDRHLLGRRDHDRAGASGVAQDVEHPAGLGADEPHVDQVGDARRRGQVADDVAGGGRVDDDEVEVRLADLPGQLADREDLLHARRGVGDEVEGLRQGAEAGDERQVQVDAQVLPQRRLGVHRHDPHAVGPGDRFETHLAQVERGGQVALGVDLAGERAPAPGGGEQRQAGRHRRLPHAALAGDDEQAAIEEVGTV